MPKRALGTKLMIGASAVTGLKTIGGIKLTADTMDMTTLDSDGQYREFAGGFKDGGEVPVSGFFEPGDTAGQNALYTAFESGVATAFSIVFPAAMGASWLFNGVVTGYGTDADMEDFVTFDATIKVSGKPTLSLTASADLTALAVTGVGGTLSPAFAAGVYYYSYSGVTAAAVKVTATLTGATIKLYVDGAFVENLTSGTASADISMAIGSKKLTIIENEASKTAKIYEIVVVKVS